MMRKFFLLLISLWIFSCNSKNTDLKLLSEEDRWQYRADHVEIVRDNFGVPHIYGKTDADAVFGMLYAQCEDDFNRVERNYIWATGRLAEVMGKKALYSDLRARLYMTREEAIENFEKSPKMVARIVYCFCRWN